MPGTTTQFGFCQNCEERKELVPAQGGLLACHSCGNASWLTMREAANRGFLDG